MAQNMAQWAGALQCAMFCGVLPMVSLWQTLHQPPIAPYPNMAHLWRKHGAMLHLLANAPCFGLVYLFRWGSYGQSYQQIVRFVFTHSQAQRQNHPRRYAFRRGRALFPCQHSRRQELAIQLHLCWQAENITPWCIPCPISCTGTQGQR